MHTPAADHRRGVPWYGGRPCAGVLSLIALTLAAAAAVAGACGEAAEVVFTDVTAQSGIAFHHRNGVEDGYKQIPESDGAGACWLDFDTDGDMDLFLVQSNRLPGLPPNLAWTSALYRNNGDGTFADFTAGTPLATVGFGQGAAAGDYDNDGDPDLYVSFVGPNRLFRNDGNGIWTDVSRQAGVDDPRWGTSVAWFDYDRDGDLDLYVANYLNWRFDDMKWARRVVDGQTINLYIRPGEYTPSPDVLYRNNGDGTFSDVSAESGIAGYSGNTFAAIAGDYDKDGWMDVYVANDYMENFLFRNRGDGTFEEVGLITGTAYGSLGEIQNGMGGTTGDINEDGWLDLVISNHQGESFALYFGGPEMMFEYASDRTGFSRYTFDPLCWAAQVLDYDNDTDLDIFFACGHIEPDERALPRGITFAQPDLLIVNDGSGEISLAGTRAGNYFARHEPSRSAACADYDNDGDVDLVVTTVNGPALLLRNDGGNRNNWLSIQLTGTASNRDGVGVKVEARVGDKVLYRERTAGEGYCSGNAPQVHLGLGAASRVDRLTLTWPSGARTVLHDVSANQQLVVEERREPQEP